jgi:HK97 family phage prohead protease
MAAMQRRLLNSSAFQIAARRGESAGRAVYRLAGGAGEGVITASSDIVRYVFSTPRVARDGHTIASSGWQLADFKTNPVFLFSHDSSMPPIGRVVGITAGAEALTGGVEYTPDDVNPFGAMVCRLVRGGFLNAVSVSWDPIKWKYSTDRSRPNGIDFLEQNLLEISQVCVPSDVGAIATARARGVNTAPLADWASRAIDEKRDVEVGRTELETLYRSARMPARLPTRISECIRTDNAAGRALCLRQVAYEAAEMGVPVPPHAWPPRTREERQAVARGAKLLARQSA